jgi:hypothetical protein
MPRVSSSALVHQQLAERAARLLARRPLRPGIERSIFPLRMFAKACDELVSHVLAQQVQIRAHTEVGKQRAHELMIFLGPLDLGRVLGF